MKVSYLLKNRYYLVFTLCFLGFGIIVALITSVINYRTHFQDIDKALYDLANFEANDKKAHLIDYVERNESILIAISDNELTLEYIEFKSPVKKNDLEQLFHALTLANKDIMQLRYLDVNGNEEIRVDRDRFTGKLTIIPMEKLQNKSSRYYFKESVVLDEDCIWHSNVDLNVENGQIELPINPTFRIATPVYINGKSEGIIIINLMFQDMIERTVLSSNFETYLADIDGESIYSPLENSSWSRYLADKNSFADLFPIDVEGIINNDFYERKGLHSFDLGYIFKNQENLRIILIPKNTVIEDLTDKNRITALIIALTVILISFPLSWVIGYIPSRLQNSLNDAFQEIKIQSDIIDKKVMISKTDKNGIILEVSEYFCQIIGYSKEELIGNKFDTIKHPETPDSLYFEMVKAIEHGDIWEGDVKNIDKKGQDVWLHYVLSPRVDKYGKLEFMTVICSDITDKINIEKMSETDMLTGLFNRRKLKTIFKLEIARFERFKSPFSVLLFDIDHFKKINDTHGHQAGDDVLILLAKTLKDNVREIDSICRWGGEEFLIISSQQSLNKGYDFAEKLRLIVESLTFSHNINVTISCGVAEYIKGESPNNIVARVDKALYIAKESGRNMVIKA